MRKHFSIPIALYDHPKVSADPDYILVIVHLYRTMNYSRGEGWFNSKSITLEKGQLVTSTRAIASTTGVNHSKVRRILAFLKSDTHIDTLTDRGSTLVTVNYEAELRGSDTGSDTQVTHLRVIPPSSPSHTLPLIHNTDNNNTENKENINKENIPPIIPPREKAYPKGFEEWWKVYPLKVGKLEAVKAWKSSGNKPPLGEMITKLEEQKESWDWQKNDGEYIPHPATYLRGGRWADEVRRNDPTPTNPYEGINWETTI